MPGLGQRLDSICGVLVDARGWHGEGCVVIARDGSIANIVEEPRGTVILDARSIGLALAPGIVDLHVHLRGLWLSYKEDEATGTREAARAGVTLVADMPNTRPQLRDPESLAMKLEALRESAVVDYMVYSGVPRDPGLAERLAGKPIAGFKVYPEDLLLEESLKAIAATGRLIVLHPEPPWAPHWALHEDPAARTAHRGCHLEALAVHLASQALEGARVHVTHTTTLYTVREARRHGYTVDVAPHHLVYHARPGGDPCMDRVNPPLRPLVEAQRLLQALLEGRVDAVASDHAPHAQWEKTEPLTCMPGYPWLGLWPWLLYRMARAYGHDLPWLLHVASYAPARILGVRHGLLEPGYRASLILVDPEARWRHTGFPYSKHRLPTHYMAEAQGLVHYTIVGGRIAYSLEQGAAEGPLGSNMAADKYRSNIQ